VAGASTDSPADWPELVGSVAYAAPDAFVLVDPLVPDELWPALEERVRAHGEPVRVLTTIGFHRRSRDEVVRRFDAATSRAKASLPAGVETVTIPRAGETMVWLPGPRALVPGDRLLGDGAGGLRMCPPDWLRYLDPGLTYDELREALRALLALPVEMVLVSHGEPVLRGGRAAVERALS
jgi:glyoxylase-like metal-dependent hydrolase (beta-lactamase superfamily II)